MKKFPALFLFFILLLFLSSFLTNKAYSAGCILSTDKSSGIKADFIGEINLYTTAGCNFVPETTYWVISYPSNMNFSKAINSDFLAPNDPNAKTDKSNPPVLTATLNYISFNENDPRDKIKGKGHEGPWKILVCTRNVNMKLCDKPSNEFGFAEINISAAPTPTPTITPTPAAGMPIIDLDAQSQCKFQQGADDVFIRVKKDSIDPKQNYVWWWDEDKGGSGNWNGQDIVNYNGFKLFKENTAKREGWQKVCIDIDGIGRPTFNRGCFHNGIRLFFSVSTPQEDISCSNQNSGNYVPVPPPKTYLSPPCSKWENGICNEVNTGLGIPINTQPKEFVKSIFGIILGLAGGIAIILIIISGYKYMTSQGNPEKLQGAKETLTSAIVGLLFIIFAMVILQLIGVDILRIPGFG